MFYFYIFFLRVAGRGMGRGYTSPPRFQTGGKNFPPAPAPSPAPTPAPRAPRAGTRPHCHPYLYVILLFTPSNHQLPPKPLSSSSPPWPTPPPSFLAKNFSSLSSIFTPRKHSKLASFLGLSYKLEGWFRERWGRHSWYQSARFEIPGIGLGVFSRELLVIEIRDKS